MSAKHQYLATFFVNLLAIGYGASCGWPSPSFLLLLSDESPLPTGAISIDESSWIAALMCAGGFVGNLLFAWLADKIGRKYTLLIIAIPTLMGWILILFAQNVYYLYAARFFVGLAGGGAFVAIPLFITEIADDCIRGMLGSTLVLSCNIGILFAFVFGNYCSYEFTPKFVCVITILFVCGFYFFPETPSFLLKQNKIMDTERSIRFYRNISKKTKMDYEVVQVELNRLKSSVGDRNAENTSNTKLKWSDFTKTVSRKALLIGLVLVSLNQLCGCFAMINYTANIFAESGSNLSPNMSAIVVGIIELFGAYISTILVDRAGRKLLITTSACGTGLGLLCLGTYSLMKSQGHDLHSFGWIPVTSFSFVIFIASCGVLTLPFLVISEIVPEKIRSFGTSMCMSVLWLLAFTMVKYLPLLSLTLGMHGSMFLFAGFSLSGAIIVMIILPETKGKSFDEIMELLR